MKVEVLNAGTVKIVIVFLFIWGLKYVITVVYRSNGHVLGFYDVKDYDRLYFQKKSIYQRKYHYEKKVNQVSKRLNLTDEQKYELYNKLMEIDSHIMEILNKKYCRKRMISIFYLIKKLLEEMGSEKYKLVYLKISPQTLENYEKWWDSYINLKE